MKPIPRYIRDVSPGEGFTRIKSKRPDGLPDGVHTGGVWTDGETVWKPLDGGNAHDGDHYPTLEAECLAEMAGEPGFPRNWWVDEFNGREWLVRKVALVYGQDVQRRDAPGLGELAETALRALNAKGWELGDAVSFAFDLDLGHWFILDLSCAAKTYAANANWDDEWRLWKFWEDEGWPHLLKLRQAARHVVSSLEVHDTYGIPFSWRWVYASRNRPLSLTWAHKLRGKVKLVPHHYANEGARVHTWVVTNGPLDDEVVHDYELTLGWWPWDTPARREK
jgi:hypothetical protein